MAENANTMFRFEDHETLAEDVLPEYGPHRMPYTHRCRKEVFEEVCHRIDECESFTLETIIDGGNGKLPSTQVAVALRFMIEYGLIESVYGRKKGRTEDSIHLSAMTCWHHLRESNV